MPETNPNNQANQPAQPGNAMPGQQPVSQPVQQPSAPAPSPAQQPVVQQVPVQPVQPAAPQQVQYTQVPNPQMQRPVQPAQPQQMPMQQMPAQQMQMRPGQPMQPMQPGMRPMQPGMQPGQPGVRPGQPGQPGAGVRKAPNPRRLLYWVLGCFGCSILLFVLFVLLFVAQTSPTGDNALAKSLGLDTASFINSLITLVNVIFGFFSIILFIMAIVGIFRTAMARKDDRDARKRNLTLAGSAGLLLIFMVFIWVGIYLFLSSKKVIAPKTVQQVDIVTEPPNTLGLTAPVTIKFDGSKLPIDNKKYEILAFLWDFGDGDTSTVQIPSHTYKNMGKNNGRFDAKVNVSVREKTANKEDTLTYSTIITISNVKLDAQFTTSTDIGPAPLKVSFDASGSSAPAGEIQAYEWDFDNNNTFTDDSGSTVEHTFEQVGKYTVNLRVTDNTGQFAIVSKDIEVQGPNLPTATIEIPTTDGNYYVGTQYSFQADKSTSPAGKITGYEWDFGDQTPHASTRTATHTYKAAGDYVVALTVTDSEGAKNQSTQKIKVENPVGTPIAAFTTVPSEAKSGDGYISGTVPFEVSFDGSPSKQENGTIVDYKWDFDGDGKEDAAGKQVKFVYNTAGNYNATLTVYDAQNKSGSGIIVVRVAAQGLQARVTADPVEGVVPLTVTFDASGSSYPSGQIVSYEWDFGDGTPKRIDVSKVTYKYTQIGTFTAKVTAIASDNSRSTVSVPVNVRPVPLKSCFEASATQGAAPLTVEFDPRCSTGTVSKYSWDFGDGETSRTRKPTHTFANPGSYQVKLEVSDNQNVIDTFNMNILVTGTVQ